MEIKPKELRQRSVNELQLALQESREKLCQLNFDLASKKLKNVHQLKLTKKQIARLLTLLCQENLKKK
jgi:ribosomal protein L29